MGEPGWANSVAAHAGRGLLDVSGPAVPARVLARPAKGSSAGGAASFLDGPGKLTRPAARQPRCVLERPVRTRPPVCISVAVGRALKRVSAQSSRSKSARRPPSTSLSLAPVFKLGGPGRIRAAPASTTRADDVARRATSRRPGPPQPCYRRLHHDCPRRDAQRGASCARGARSARSAHCSVGARRTGARRPRSRRRAARRLPVGQDVLGRVERVGRRRPPPRSPPPPAPSRPSTATRRRATRSTCKRPRPSRSSTSTSSTSSTRTRTASPARARATRHAPSGPARGGAPAPAPWAVASAGTGTPCATWRPRTRLWLKVLIAAVIIAAAVAIGIGVSKAVGASAWKSPTQTQPIARLTAAWFR